MENPRKRTTVATAAGGDGLHLFDHQQQQMYDLNTTSALVWQHCDGQTRPLRHGIPCPACAIPPLKACRSVDRFQFQNDIFALEFCYRK